MRPVSKWKKRPVRFRERQWGKRVSCSRTPMGEEESRRKRVVTFKERR